MEKIKVLHLIKSLGRGGAEMLLPETLSLHEKENFEFHYIYFLPWKNQMVEEIENAGGKKVTCFPAKNNIQLLKKYKEVSLYCQNEEIDLIHCHLPWSGFLGRIVHYKTKIPLVYTEHNIQERYHPATKFLNKFSFNYQSLALGVSNDVTRSIMENIKPKIFVQTLFNGVNTQKFSRDMNARASIRKKYKIPENALVIGNLAVFREQKNIPLWLDAFNEIKKEFPTVFGLLVGAGPKEEDIKLKIKELNLENQIFLPGLQTDTIGYFSAMDIFMMSSDFEGLPIALLEAMSMQCAIVSTKAGGVSEVVKDGQDGLLADIGDFKLLANQAKNLIENDLKRKSLQQAARAKVKANFSLKNMVAELEVVYKKVLEK